MILYYIRHAQSGNNALYESTGSSKGRSDDPSLTPTGEAQAHQVAEWLASLPEPPPLHRHSDLRPSHIYCSLMKRAVQTGSVIATRLGLPLQGVPDLHETGGIYLDEDMEEDHSVRPGLGRSQLENLHRGLVLPPEVGESGWYNRPFEEHTERVARARRLVTDLLERHAGTSDRVVLVSHGTFYNYFLAELWKLEAGTEWWLRLNNTGVTRLEFHSDVRVLAYANRTAHLPPELIT